MIGRAERIEAFWVFTGQRMYMKLVKARRNLTAYLLTAISVMKVSLASGQTPSILAQPQSQTVVYANDVSYSVSAEGGEPLAYQWLKDGQPMIDFDNVAGSQTSTLHVVGVAENDAAKYSVIITNQSGAITSSVATLSILPTTEFTENFESGLTNWLPLFNASALTLDIGNNHTSSGNTSLLATNGGQNMYHNLAVKYACRTVLAFWMYDDGSSLSGCARLRGYTGPGYARYTTTNALLQELAIGKYNNPFGSSGATGALAGQTLDTNKYQGRVARGLNQGWFNLDAPGSPNRSIGWHQFQIDRSATGSPGGRVYFYVDGILSRTITNAAGGAINSILLGSLEGGTTNGTPGNVWFDDLTFETYPAMYDWQDLASTGSRVFPDWMQLREVGTEPSVVDASVSTVSAQSGSETNDGLGDWVIAGSAIQATGLRGYLEYNVSAPTDDAYRIEIEGRETDYKMPEVDLPLIVSIDGETLGRFNLPYGPTTNGYLHCFTPYILAGNHVVRVYWDNSSRYCKLLVQAVRLQSVSSGAINGRHAKVWVWNRLRAQCGVDVAPASSAVSPVCIEGPGQYLSMMTVLAGLDSGITSASVNPGAGHRWYANVPLSPDQPTVIQTSFQNGGYKITNEVEWQVTDLLNTNNVVIRQGDSLLLAAFPEGVTNGQMTIAVSGSESVSMNAESPVPYQFNQAGTYTVTGIYLPTGETGSITVKVVSASFDSPAPARVFKPRYWSCTNLPPEAVLDADPRLRVKIVSDSERARITPAPPQKMTNEQDFWVRITSAESEYILARLGANGPVMAAAPVQGFHWNIAPYTYLRLLGQNEDGSQTIETAFVMSPLIPRVTVQTQIIVSGVTFDDGTVSRALTAGDFDATGVYRLRFIRAAGVRTSTCHTTHLYDGTTLLGFQ